MKRIRLICVEFDEPVILDGLNLADGLDIASSIFRGGFQAEAVIVGRHAKMQRVSVAGAATNTDKSRSFQLNSSTYIHGLDLQVTDGSDVYLYDTQVTGTLHLIGSRIGRLLAYNMGADDLFMQGITVARAEMWGIRVDGDLYAKGAMVGILDLTGAVIGREITLDEGEFQRLKLGGVDVGGQVLASRMKVVGLAAPQLTARAVTISNSAFDCRVDLRDMFVKTHANLGHNRLRRGIDLKGTRVNGNLSIDQSKLNPGVEDRCFKSDSNTEPEILSDDETLTMKYVQVGGDLNLFKSVFQDVHLQNSNVAGDLDLKELQTGDLMLTGTQVGGVSDDENAWGKGKLNLSGFRITAVTLQLLLDRKRDWFENLLARSKPYAAQPYAMFSSLLQGVGRGSDARYLRYLARTRETEEQKDISVEHVTAVVAGLVAGYGYHTERLLLIALGMLVLAIAIVCFDPASKASTNAKGGWRGSLERLEWSTFYVLEVMIPFLSVDAAYANARNQCVLNQYNRIALYLIKIIAIGAGVMVLAELSGLLTLTSK